MGPTGQGPRTGRGAGYCGGNETPGSTTAGRGGGGNRGRNRGGGGRGQGRRGWRNLFHAMGLTGWQRAATGEQAADDPVAPAPTPPAPPNQVEQDEVATLKDHAADLSRSLQEIQSRLDKLEERNQVGPSAESASE